MSGTLHVPADVVSVGQPDSGGLSYVRVYDSIAQQWRDNLTGTINSSGSTYTVTLMGQSSQFTLTGGVFVPAEGQGSSLTFNSGTNQYTFTTEGGAVAIYSKALAGANPTQANEGRVTTLTLPSGEVLTFAYTAIPIFLAPDGQRLQSVTNNLGYQIHLQYSNSDPNTGAFTLVLVQAINNAIDYCSPTANTCTSLSRQWPSLLFQTSGANQTATDVLGRVTTYTFSSGRITAVAFPGGTTRSYGYNSSLMVESVSNGTSSWTYEYSDASGVRTTTVTDPLSHQRVLTVNLTTGRVNADRDGLNRTTNFTYDGQTRLTRVTQPEGNYTEFTYDARGNITQTTIVPKSGSGLSNIVISAGFDSTCANLVTCNRPNFTIDPRGNQTDYTYNSTHGGLLTATAPAPSVGAVRPQTRFTYSSLYAWYKNSGGTIVQAPSPVTRLTGISACATTASCASGADETRTTITYGASGVANNLAPTQAASGSGDGALTATVAATYDPNGDVLTVDGPLSGSADTTRYRYDLARQTIGVVGPDPDGAGALKNRAVRVTYNGNGQATLVERGIANGQSDADWAAFVMLEQVSTTYDSIGRRTRDILTAWSAVRAVTQYAYDNANRQTCTAVRNNAAVFGSLPGSACTLGTTGSFGPDRITQNTYDGANQLTEFTVALGTADERDEATMTYTTNGAMETLTDARGYRTTYVFDGFDRLSRIRYPLPNTTGQSSTTDYEEYAYDAASNVTQDRRRDAQNFTFTYDNLNRLTLRDAPAGENDVTFGYDNFSRMISAAYSGHTLTFGFDALSRNVSQAGPLGTVSYQYDLASRRTRVTWPDAFYAVYEYDLTDAVTAIRENGASSGPGVLATYTYNNLGQRVSVARGNGVASAYAYDTAQRLQSLAHDLAGTTNDQTYRFSYNPAGQSVERVGTNSAYAWPAPSNGTTAYTRNGLDQYTAVGGASYSYDSRGNLSSNGTQSYGYDAANRLTTAPGSSALSYDPMDRLYQVSVSGTGTRFLYDGVQAIGEYNASGTLLRRYVPGPVLDEPITWYEGSGTSDRRWLVADQLGTIVAVTDGSGAATNINTFDEYGQPGVSNAGRFQYTGQAWLAEAGLQYSRARAYAATIGRFLQTDPILQAGGMNIYAYVRNDPVNWIDPLGLDEEEIVVLGRRFLEDPNVARFTERIRQALRDLSPGGTVLNEYGETLREEDGGFVLTAPRPQTTTPARPPPPPPPPWVPWLLRGGGFLTGLFIGESIGDSDYQCTNPNDPNDNDCGAASGNGPTRPFVRGREYRDALRECRNQCSDRFAEGPLPGPNGRLPYHQPSAMQICIRQCMEDQGYSY